jgi:hypothetical protein
MKLPLATIPTIKSELFQYCPNLLSFVVEGENLVQDSLIFE